MSICNKRFNCARVLFSLLHFLGNERFGTGFMLSKCDSPFGVVANSDMHPYCGAYRVGFSRHVREVDKKPASIASSCLLSLAQC